MNYLNLCDKNNFEIKAQKVSWFVLLSTKDANIIFIDGCCTGYDLTVQQQNRMKDDFLNIKLPVTLSSHFS